MDKGGVRISGGTWKGRRLRGLPGVRPSSGRLREALASRWLNRLSGAEVLDLYAGTGAVGLELLGRGANRVVAVEASRPVATKLRGVLEEWGVGDLEVVAAEALEWLAGQSPAFDLAFADPPYLETQQSRQLQTLVRSVAGVLRPGGEFALEVRSEANVPSDVGALDLTTRRRYGDSELVIFTRN